ncbi:MAG TPA: hypothetical protein PLD47_00030 [Aggregatilineales bacterium]|nr:hypothetical protein [Anaerolineales bacterium]HRE46085.1 hypothetical protein [Aggregatilineales bacterium]
MVETLVHIRTAAPLFMIILFVAGAACWLLAFRFFTLSRTESFWRRRRAAGQQGFRLALIGSSALFAGILAGGVSIGAELVTRQRINETALSPTLETPTGAAVEVASTPTSEGTPTPEPPTETPFPMPVMPSATPISGTLLSPSPNATETTTPTETLTPRPLVEIASATSPPRPTLTPSPIMATVTPTPPASTTAEPDAIGVNSTAQKTPTRTDSLLATNTLRPTRTPTPTHTPSQTATFTPSFTATFTPTFTATTPFTPTALPTNTATPSATIPPSSTPTATFLPLTVAGEPTLASSVTPAATAKLTLYAFATQINPDGTPLNPTTRFRTGLGRLYYFVSAEDMRRGVIWRRELWRGGILLSAEEGLWVGAETSSRYYFVGLEGGFTPGNYEIRLYIGRETPIPATVGAFVVE